MNADEIQQISESLIIAALNGGPLVGLVFRHDDTAAPVKKDMVSVLAGGPVPQLEGPRGFRVEVTIELRTSTAARNSALTGEAMRRVTDATILRGAALTAGLLPKDDLIVLDEEMSGDRERTSNLRKRTIVVPLIIRIN